jgi:hypothetical protein
MTYALVLVRGMGVAIGSSRNEKTCESREQPKRFSLRDETERNYETNQQSNQERAEIPVR